jgi:hypothetical protein
MPKVENFDHTPILVHAVVNLQGRMEKPPYSGISLYGRPEVRKVSEKINVSEEGARKPFAGSWMPFPGPAHDRFQVC